jgi:hypothetical protein
MLLLASSVCGLFKWRQFEPEVILLAVGWYLGFSLSYRDVEELLAERGLRADHVTVWRWVQRYGPEMEQRLRRRLKPTNDSWRVDETYIRVKVEFIPVKSNKGTKCEIGFYLMPCRAWSCALFATPKTVSLWSASFLRFDSDRILQLFV